MTIAWISHPDCALHEMGEQHPESPARLDAIHNQLLMQNLHLALREYDAPLASREQLGLVHAPEYVAGIFRQAPTQGRIWLDPDTLMNPHSLRAALRAAGALVLAVDLVMSGQHQSAFCAIRPPGHHAGRDCAMGFCLFNNIAIGAAHALATHRLERIALVDFDVHHGNGTEQIFPDHPAVLFCSTFQHPFYPHSDLTKQSPQVVHAPLPAGSGGQAMRDAVTDLWLPRLEQFRPQLILVSAGFDAHVEDEMSGLRWVDQDYAWITAQIKRVADRHAGGRIVSTLEGGYALSALGRGVAAHLRALL